MPQRRTHDQKSAERGGGESRSRLFKQGQTTDMIPQEMDMGGPGDSESESELEAGWFHLGPSCGVAADFSARA